MGTASGSPGLHHWISTPTISQHTDIEDRISRDKIPKGWCIYGCIELLLLTPHLRTLKIYVPHRYIYVELGVENLDILTCRYFIFNILSSTFLPIDFANSVFRGNTEAREAKILNNDGEVAHCKVYWALFTKNYCSAVPQAIWLRHAALIPKHRDASYLQQYDWSLCSPLRWRTISCHAPTQAPLRHGARMPASQGWLFMCRKGGKKRGEMNTFLLIVPPTPPLGRRSTRTHFQVYDFS